MNTFRCQVESGLFNTCSKFIEGKDVFVRCDLLNVKRIPLFFSPLRLTVDASRMTIPRNAVGGFSRDLDSRLPASDWEEERKRKEVRQRKGQTGTRRETLL